MWETAGSQIIMSHTDWETKQKAFDLFNKKMSLNDLTMEVHVSGLSNITIFNFRKIV